MTTRIIIARHGNTFTKDQIPTRVGCRTDLPLVENERGLNIGRYLKKYNLMPDVVFASPLQRTMQTARLALQAMDSSAPLYEDNTFKEIDYGPDENKTEEEVIARIGQDAIDNWNKKGIVPDGWIVDVPFIIQNWKAVADNAVKQFHDKTVLIVSSNGIIRFAPYLTGDFEAFSAEHDIKVGTGCLCIFEKEDTDNHFKCVAWNVKPSHFLDECK